MSMSSYTQGALVDFFLPFVNEDGVTPVDPTTVAFKYSCGTTGPVTLTYSGASSAGTGIIWRTGTGNYTARVDTTPFYGTFTGEAISTGVGQTTNTTQVIILQRPI